MTMSKNPKRYTDAQKLLDIAIAQGECLITFKKSAQAVHMAQRVNAFQRLMEQLDPETLYTGFMCQRRGVQKEELHIVFRTVEAGGGIIKTEYEENDIKPPLTGRPNDPLDSVAAMLKKEGLLNE